MADMKFDLYHVDSSMAQKGYLENMVAPGGEDKAGSFIYAEDVYGGMHQILYIVGSDGKAVPINFDSLHPVGSVYTSVSDTTPVFLDSKSLGFGTWQKLDDFISLVDDGGTETTLHMWKRTD